MTLADGVVVLQSAFRCRIVSYRVTPSDTHLNVKDFMESAKPKILPLVRSQLGKLKSLKVNFELFGYFILEAKERGDVKSFNTKNEIVVRGTDLEVVFQATTGVLDAKVAEFQERDSGK